MNFVIEEVRSWSDIEIGFIVLEILFGVASILIVAKLTSIQETLEKISKELKGIKDNHIAELKGENKKECSTCKSDNSHENCLGCIEYGHWELKGDNNEDSN